MSRLATLIDGRHLATADPLGLGGLLMDAARLDQLAGSGPWSDSVLLRSVLASAEEGLRLSRAAGRPPATSDASSGFS